jgi:Flp pilus assembly protein TadD
MSEIPIEQLMQTARDHWAGQHPEQAEPLLAEVIRRSPETAEAHYLMGLWHLRKSRIAQAEASFRAALRSQPGDWQSLNNLGAILAKTGRAKEAEQTFALAAVLRPTDALAQLNLGNACTLAENREGAIAAYRLCLDLRPDIAEAHVNLAVALRATGRLEEALPHFQKAADLETLDFNAQINLGSALRDLGHFADARSAFQRVLDQRPDHAETHWNVGMLQLMEGKFAEGWHEYEWRRTVKNSGWQLMIGKHHVLNQARWVGGDAAGRRIYIFAEQGFGDTIQFARYVPMVAERGAKIVLAVASALVPVLRDLPGVERCVSVDEPVSRFNDHCPLMSLPLIFKTTLESIPRNVPYLLADPGKAAAWGGRLGQSKGARKVGLTWSDPALTGSLAALVPVGNVRWIGLQKPDAGLPERLRLENFAAELTDLTEVAALIDQLDLVITTDTVVAHLAGAMGKPVWTLLPFCAHWRWMRGRDDSPWYPTMRLFRQEKNGDWDVPVRRVAEALAEALPSAGSS